MTVDVRLELQRTLNSESSKQLPRPCSEQKTTTSRLKRSSELRGDKVVACTNGAVWAEGGQPKEIRLARFEIVMSLFTSVRERQRLKVLLPYSNEAWMSEMFSELDCPDCCGPVERF